MRGACGVFAMTGARWLLLLLLVVVVMVARAQNPGAEPPTARQERARTLNALAATLRQRVDLVTTKSIQLELVFLIDASASVGEANFRGELNFVRKLLSDFRMEPQATRVSVVTFAGRGQIVRHVDYVSQAGSRRPATTDKCQLLGKQLDNVSYTGGGTYTYGALMEAFAILEHSRAGAEKVVFLVTDGFSNGGDPRYAANLLKGLGVTIFTFGIQSGNVDELRDIASEPYYAHSYFLNSFLEFETLARKALHRDVKAGVYARASDPGDCSVLCAEGKRANGSNVCCDPMASCSCATASGHYACVCPSGFFGSGLVGSCQPCPNGTYGLQADPNDLSVSCLPCPDVNHVTLKIPATSQRDCTCASGFTGDRGTCGVITCPELQVPQNGYFVKENACNNVVNAACGIRCRIGFHLTGDSIRLCSRNGSWTGEQTQCSVKTCAALRAPVNGRIRCEYENENNHSKLNDKTVQPIDTRCQFKCESGFQLRGSKIRNCLPLARWDGLKTTCKPIYCEPLKPVVNAVVHPKTCSGPRKLAHGSNCTITCKKGYRLEGPKTRTCVGRHGTWSKRHSVNRCIDKTRPVLNCPANKTVTTLPGKNYAYVNWPVPNATDNSGAECSVWSKPHVTFPWKAHIGKHTIKYIAQDVSGNRARCSFHLHVLDKEPPKVENCVNNQLSLTGSEKNLKDFTWDEPIFHDNSGSTVRINKTFHSSTGSFAHGRHYVSYRAVDKYENFANCVVNLTMKDECDDVPKPLNGRVECANIGKGGKRCSVSCDLGYAFAFETATSKISKNQTVQIVTCYPTNHTWNVANFPDCTPIQVSDSISQEVSAILEGEQVNCDNATLLDNLTKNMKKSYNSTVITICGNELECEIQSEIDCKKYGNRTSRNIETYGVAPRRKRFSERSEKDKTDVSGEVGGKEQIEIKFTILAKIIEENHNNSRKGYMKLREKIYSMAKSGELNLSDEETNREISRLPLNLHLLFKDPLEICKVGTVLRKHGCLNCPAGTFHNITRGKCQSCAIGEYQNELGSIECDKCPDKFYTRRMHTRLSTDCVPACRPGHYSRRRHHPDLTVSLAPCVSCEIGFYQPQYGQSECLPCPRNTITEGRAASEISDCLPVNRTHIDFCRSNPCLNRATCVKERYGFSCDCRDHYVGSRCEIFIDPCLSSPCSSAGQCILTNNTDGLTSYTCMCKPGYTGKFCESLINECSYNPCRNGGTCLSDDMDITCTCRDGFEGDFCEIAVNHCSPSPCEMNSTCRTVNGTWKCFCKPGYLGLRCTLLPCDWLPCHPNQICVNVPRENTDKSDYRCVCPAGFTGRGCLTRINHCENHRCQNNGTCVNNLSNYTCNCLVPFTGLHCETELPSNYVMHFSRSGITDYVIIPGPAKSLTELTVCLWLQSVDTFNYGTVISYATLKQDNAFTLSDYNGFVLYVNGEIVITDARLNDGYWHFICVSWENKLGSWQLFVDGILKDNGTNLSTNMDIQAGGTFVFGQEQDVVGGGFSESESFVGKLSMLDVWDRASRPDQIIELSKTCQKYHGSLVAWAQLQEHIRGEIKIVESSFCQGCPPPVAPFKGYVNVSENGLEVVYTCEPGYEFRKNYEHFKSLKRTCLKHGHWEGFQVPNCVRINCPFPGYFLRGQIQGRSYMYGDKITYYCNDGYELRGNSQRICKADGKWSGGAPFCIGVTCKNLLAPDHGDIEYIVAEHDRDDLSILQVGQQLEFKCDRGYFLNGQKVLTCLENGTWDFKRPKCTSLGCPSPKRISNGQMVANISSDFTGDEASLGISRLRSSNESPPLPSEAVYFYGDVVAFSCEPGYKFEGNHNLLEEFKLQCTANGTWTGFVPDCVPLQCPQPESLPNAKTYLLNTGKSSSNGSVGISLNELFNDSRSSNENNGDISDLEVIDTKNTPNNTFKPGTQIKIICDDGYTTTVTSTIQNCTENEDWSGEPVHCVPLECSAVDHAVIGIFVNNNTAKSSIETQDFTFDEVDTENHEQENSTDSFKRLIRQFDFFFEGESYGDKVILQCRNNFGQALHDENFNESNLQFIWRCDKEGKWKFIGENVDESDITDKILNVNENICVSHECRPPIVPLHGSIKYVDSVGNETDERKNIRNLIFECNQGYVLTGSEKSVCRENGTWSSIPSCQLAMCEKPPDVPYAKIENKTMKSNSLSFGSTISYQCTAGYRIIGQMHSECLMNGRWSRVNGRCARISCGKPHLIEGSSIQGDSYLYQDRLIYVCPGGKFRDFIVCNQDGKWTTLPECTENN